MACKIETLKDNNRMSTQELLQTINEKIQEGVTEFEIEACGQNKNCYLVEDCKGNVKMNF